MKSHREAIVKALVSHAVVRFDFLINLSGEVGWFLFFLWNLLRARFHLVVSANNERKG